MKKIKFIFLALLLVLLVAAFVALSFNNNTPVEFNYLFGKIELPLAWLFTVAFAAGMLLLLPFYAFSAWYWRRRANKLSKQLVLEKQLSEKQKIADVFQAEKNQFSATEQK